MKRVMIWLFLMCITAPLWCKIYTIKNCTKYNAEIAWSEVGLGGKNGSFQLPASQSQNIDTSMANCYIIAARSFPKTITEGQVTEKGDVQSGMLCQNGFLTFESEGARIGLGASDMNKGTWHASWDYEC